MISIKSQDQIALMREACRVAAEVLDALRSNVRVGITTFELDQIAKNLIIEQGAVSACHNYTVGSRRFPSYSCISVNEEVVHGIGSIDRTLRNGDVVALDVVVSYRGYIGDNACTVPVGVVSPETQNLLRVTEGHCRRESPRRFSAGESVIFLLPFSVMLKPTDFPWCANSWATVSVSACMKNPRSRISVAPEPARNCGPG